MSGFVQAFVDNERALAGARGKRFVVRKATRMQPAKQVERAYTAYLLQLVLGIKNDIDEILLPDVDRIVREATGRTDGVRHDVEDIEATLRRATGDITARFNARHLRELEAKIEQYRAATSTHNMLQLRRQLRRMISLDAMPPGGTAERVLMESFLTANVKLISSLSGDYVSQVEDIVRRGVQAGDRAVVLKGQILGRWSVTQSRARLIARDQISKLQGALTRVRQTSLGLEKYIWRTSRDERVRETHLVKEGRVFSWDDPPSDTGHPGQDYQCRCTAEPYIEGYPPPQEDRQAVIEEVRAQRERLAAQMAGRRRNRRRRG